MVGLSSETIRGFLLQIVGQFQWDKDVLLQDFWVPLFQTSLLFLTGSEANPMLELMTSKHKEDPPGDAMPCHATSHREKKTISYFQLVSHYNASYNPNYYPKSQSCLEFWIVAHLPPQFATLFGPCHCRSQRVVGESDFFYGVVVPWRLNRRLEPPVMMLFFSYFF